MSGSKKIDLFVPGRLCLFGEHSDWAGTSKSMNAAIVPGCAIVTGIEQGIYATAEKSGLFSLTSRIPAYSGEGFSCPMDTELLRAEAHKGGFFSYVAGVASYLCEWYHVSGVHIEITDMDLPMKKGFSSSAAVCVLVAKAFNELYELHLNTLGIMNIAYLGEQRTPSRCGRLDQACAFGVRPVAMTFDGNEIKAERISIGKPLYYVFADLMAGKDTVRILADLNSAYPFAKNEREKKLHEALGEDNRRITQRAIELMAAGDSERLGALMREAQALFDEKVRPMSPVELASPVLHKVLEDETVRKLTYGAKGVGSQGDGAVQLLAKDRESQEKLIAYLSSSLGMTVYALTLRPNKIIRKAVIPVAGFGTRLYPETRFVKKEFCPVVDRDGLVKPILLVLLEELDSIGIEEICLVINPEEEKLYQELLLTPISENHYKKLPDAMKQYEDRIRHIVKKIRFALQREPKGFGHAVFQAAEFAGDEPVLMLLGDTVYESNSVVPCTQQLVDAFELYGKPMAAIQRVPFEEVGSFGIFAGVWENRQETVMRCTRIVEKPNAVYAREYLNVRMTKSAENCFGAFGAYILTPEVFAGLKQAVEENDERGTNEVELTDVLYRVSQADALYGFLVDGRSFDLGNARAYRNTVARFGLGTGREKPE